MSSRPTEPRKCLTTASQKAREGPTDRLALSHQNHYYGNKDLVPATRERLMTLLETVREVWWQHIGHLSAGFWRSGDFRLVPA